MGQCQGSDNLRRAQPALTPWERAAAANLQRRADAVFQADEVQQRAAETFRRLDAEQRAAARSGSSSSGSSDSGSSDSGSSDSASGSSDSGSWSSGSGSSDSGSWSSDSWSSGSSDSSSEGEPDYFESKNCTVDTRSFGWDPELFKRFRSPTETDEIKLGAAVAHFLKLTNHRDGGFEYRHNSRTKKYGLPTCHWESDKNFPNFKSKKTSAQAIRCLFECSQDKIIECRTAMHFSNLRALLELLGEEDFNKLFPAGLEVATKNTLDSLWKENGNCKCQRADALPLGAWVVFRNHDDYGKRQEAMGLALRPFGRENGVVCSKGPLMFRGFGVKDADEEHMCTTLMKAYNSDSAAAGDNDKIARVDKSFPRLRSWEEVPGIKDLDGVISYKLIDLGLVRKKLGKTDLCCRR